MSQQRRITRRGMLAVGGGLAVAGITGGLAAVAMKGSAGTDSASAGVPSSPDGSAAAALKGRTDSASAGVPSSQRFDLTQPSHELFREKPLAQGTVMQAFTFDNVNQRLFVAQLKNGGGSDAAGDLCVTQVDFAGNQVGHMFLNGFGHGVSIGVEPVGSTSYLWTEVDAVNARGTRLARFPFASGTTLEHDASVLEKHLPIAGVDTVTCTTDPINQRLVMRYHTGGAFRYAVYNIADVRAGNYRNRLADVAEPAGLGTFQGYAAYGEYVYLLDGEAYSDTNPPPGNAHVSSLNVNTGAFTRVANNAGASLTHREPEGMAVYRTDSGETRLFLGMASGTTPGQRLANIFYKNVLI